MVRKNVALKKLRLDGDTQPRTTIDDDVVAEYAAAYKAKAKIPPLVVFFDGVDRWLADGFHRWHGATSVGIKSTPCDVRKGTREDARWFSYSANQTHGLRRSNADKVKAVKAAIKHPKATGMTDVKLASHVGVSGSFVGKIRKQLEDARETPSRPRPSRGSTGSNDSTPQPDSGDTESDANPDCPNCGGSDFDEDGSCAKCHEPDVVESEDEEQPEVKTDKKWEAIRKTVLAYVNAHGVAGIARLENLLEEARS